MLLPEPPHCNPQRSNTFQLNDLCHLCALVGRVGQKQTSAEPQARVPAVPSVSELCDTFFLFIPLWHSVLSVLGCQATVLESPEALIAATSTNLFLRFDAGILALLQPCGIRFDLAAASIPRTAKPADLQPRIEACSFGYRAVTSPQARDDLAQRSSTFLSPFSIGCH